MDQAQAKTQTEPTTTPPSKAGVHTYRVQISCKWIGYIDSKKDYIQGNTFYGGKTLLIPKWYTLHSFCNFTSRSPQVE